MRLVQKAQFAKAVSDFVAQTLKLMDTMRAFRQVLPRRDW